MANSPISRTVPPSKPHFFQPLLPGFLHQLSIPRVFIKNYLGGGEGACKDGLLRSGSGRCWPVKIKNWRFEAGWTEFAQEHDLHTGDFAVFRHEGECVFHVEVYEPDATQREYPPYHSRPVHQQQKQELQEESSNVRAVSVDSMDDFDVQTSAAKKSKLTLRRPVNQQAVTPKAEAAFPAHSHSYFVATLTQSSLQRFQLLIPTAFARANGVSMRSCQVILRDQYGKSWHVKLKHWKSSGQIYMGKGWGEVATAHGLKEGDSVMFKFIEGEKTIIMNFSVCSRSSHPAPEQKLKQEPISTENSESSEQEESLDLKPLDTSTVGTSVAKKAKLPTRLPMNKQAVTPKAEDSSPPHSYFVATVTQSRLDNNHLLIPMVFARANGISLRCCQAILHDQFGYSWHVKLNHHKCRDQVYMGKGWRDVVMAHGLKKGDLVRFEFIKGGKTIIMKFSVGLSTSKQAKHFMPKPKREMTTKGITSLPAEDHTCFMATVTRHNIMKSQFNIPKHFAKANGLCNRFCLIILRDQRGKQWPMTLRHLKGSGMVYIASGWRKFAQTHSLKKGDTVMLKLIEGGERPIMNFYGPYGKDFREPK